MRSSPRHHGEYRLRLESHRLVDDDHYQDLQAQFIEGDKSATKPLWDLIVAAYRRATA